MKNEKVAKGRIIGLAGPCFCYCCYFSLQFLLVFVAVVVEAQCVCVLGCVYNDKCKNRVTTGAEETR